MGQHAFVPTFLNKVRDGGGHSSSGMMCLQRQLHFVGTFLTFRSLICATTENINLWKLVLVSWKDYSKIISMVFLIYLIQYIIFVRKLAQVFTENLLLMFLNQNLKGNFSNAICHTSIIYRYVKWFNIPFMLSKLLWISVFHFYRLLVVKVNCFWIVQKCALLAHA